MLKNLRNCLIILLFFTIQGNLIAQENKSTTELKAEAASNYDAGKYSAAYDQYKSLLTRYPKDGIFSYYCGMCLLNMKKDLPASIGYLEFASSKPTVPDKVLYYLGIAYTQNYQFPEAKKAFGQFATIASKQDLKDMIPERRSEMSQNAVNQTTTYNTVDILSSSLFTFSSPDYFNKIRTQGGTLCQKPKELASTETGLSNLMFIPQDTQKPEMLFFSALSKNKKRGYDIFMVKPGKAKKYSEPVPVDVINTQYNDILPYYDPIGSDLFFASEGHNSIGGYDLFKTHYDSEHNAWTPPVNLGFPINSPSNEYLAIPGSDLGNVLIITDRQGLDTMLTAYLLRIHEPRKKMDVADHKELKKIGNFGGIESITDMTDISTADILNESNSNKKPATEPSVVTNVKTSTQTIPVSTEYNKYLRLALEAQFKADSTARLAREGRLKVKNVSNPDERWAVQKNIISWEKQSDEFQKLADEYYLQVKQMEKGSNATTKNVPETIEKDTVINDITVYKFKPESKTESKTEIQQESFTKEVKQESESEPKPVPVVTETIPVQTVTEVKTEAKSMDKSQNRFVILSESSYSANNPFPEDIIPAGAYYKIQLAVLSQDPGYKAFGGISPITFEVVQGKPMKRFYAGAFSNYENAKTALEEVRKKGFPQAFIVSWYDGQKMAVSKVSELEKKN